MPTYSDWSAGTPLQSEALVPGIPSFVGNATGQIYITFDTGSNSHLVEYAIYVRKDGVAYGYLQGDGTIAGGEDWNTYDDWGGAKILVDDDVVVPTSYFEFKVKARSEENVETDFSAYSGKMVSGRELAYGPLSPGTSLTITKGNTKVSGLTLSGNYGTVSIGFTLTNKASETSSVAVKYMKSDDAYADIEELYTIKSTNKVINFTSDQGTQDITIAEGTHNSGNAMATALQTAMNASPDADTLTGSGTIVFSVAFDSDTQKYTIDAGDGHTIKINFWATTTTGGHLYGFSASSSQSQAITSDFSVGDCIRVLPASSSGSDSTIKWHTCNDLGKSYSGSDISIQVTPYDEGGDADTPAEITAQTINNRPTSITLAEIHGYTWDKDETPEFVATMGDIRCGNALFFIIYVYDSSGNLVESHSSANVITGWEYEQTYGDGYDPVTVNGVSPEYTGSNQRIKYTFQNNLTDGATYTFKIRQAEAFNET